MRRVVVTGLGMVTPLACGVEPTWRRLINGESGARRIESFDVSDLAAKIACQVPRGDGADGSFNPDQWMEPKEQRKVDDFIIFAVCAAQQALDDAAWKPSSYEDQIATGVLIGSGIGGLTGIADVMVAGGAESPVSRIGVAGFIACRALSTSFNDTPERASRPYDRDRDGFVIGEGAGIVVLETYEHAKRRGARIYAELIGYGLSAEAHHITAPCVACRPR